MAVNPAYAARPTIERERHPVWKPQEMGDKIVGVLTDVSDILTLENKKWKQGDPDYLKTYRTQIFNLKDADGKEWALFIGESDFPTLGVALGEVGLFEPQQAVGWTFGWKWESVFTRKNGNLGKSMKAMFKAPESA